MLLREEALRVLLSLQQSFVLVILDLLSGLSKGRVLLEGDPKTLPGLHGLASLEELFIAVAREPLRVLEGS